MSEYEKEYEKDKAEFARLMDKVDAIQNTLIILLQQKAKRARAAARRFQNQHDAEVQQFELFEGLAYDLENKPARQEAGA